MITVIAIYHGPPGSPKPVALRAEHLNIEAGRPDWKDEPQFFDDLEKARAKVNQQKFRRQLPTARDRRELPLLVEMWIEKAEAEA